VDPGDTSAAWGALVLGYVASLVLPFVYFTVLNRNERGQTWGKRAAGIRVVDERTGGPIGYGRAFGRYGVIVLLGILVLPWILDFLWPVWDNKNQAWHDKAVGSVVVKAKAPKAPKRLLRPDAKSARRRHEDRPFRAVESKHGPTRTQVRLL
jgi:uncharacterized RDD family membrane protein YckC